MWSTEVACAVRKTSIESVTLKLSTHLSHSMFSQHTNFQICAGTGTHPPGQREKNSPRAGQSLKLRALTLEGWRARFCAPVRLCIPLGDHANRTPSEPGHILSSCGRSGQRARLVLERGVETVLRRSSRFTGGLAGLVCLNFNDV